jgi:hypothetical protein
MFRELFFSILGFRASSSVIRRDGCGICFAIQWAIVLRHLANLTEFGCGQKYLKGRRSADTSTRFCSWYAVMRQLPGSAIENSLWAVAFLLIAGALLRCCLGSVVSFNLRWIAVAGIAGYRYFCAGRCPMYFNRWQADVTSGKELLGLFAGLHDVSTRWAVTHDIAHWK